MIVSRYGTAHLTRPLDKSAGDLMASFLIPMQADPENRGLPAFGQWLAYRHELYGAQIRGVPVDEWQSPQVTALRRVGDCEDLTFYYICSPPCLGRYEPAAWAAGPNTAHALVADWSRPGIWMVPRDAEVYIPSKGRRYRKGEGPGILDPSYWCGMEHPDAEPSWPLYGGVYAVGANICTPETDMASAMAWSQFRRKLYDV